MTHQAKHLYFWLLFNFLLPIFPVIIGGSVLLLQGKLTENYLKLFEGTDLLLLSFTVFVITAYDWNISNFDKGTFAFAVTNSFLIIMILVTLTFFMIVYLDTNSLNLGLTATNILGLNTSHVTSINQMSAIGTCCFCTLIQVFIVLKKRFTGSEYQD